MTDQRGEAKQDPWKQLEAMARAIDPTLPADLSKYEVRITLSAECQSVECILRESKVERYG